MSDNIPYEIQEEIIKRFPIKSLLQFRTVSKQWKSFIDSSEFIANYHRTQPQHHLLVSSWHNETYIAIADNDSFPQQKLSVTVPMSVYKDYCYLVGSSQGLFCFSDFKATTAVIWNPTIRKSVSIPLPNVLGKEYVSYVAFGVCPDTCDPMLVKFTSKRMWKVGDAVVDVFRLSTQTWKRLTTNLRRELVVFMKNQVVIDRFIYWQAFNTGSIEYRLIMSFDMITEEFKELNLPNTLALPRFSERYISKVRESLVVVQMRYEDAKGVVATVWMMDDNDPKSFTKQFIINTPIGIDEVYAFRRNGEPIIGMAEDDPNNVGFFVYESDSEHINRIGITVPQQQHTCDVSSYTETLLLLDH